MNKRNLATVLWFFMGWTLGSALAIVVGLPTLLCGVLLAIAFAAFIRIGPGRRLWPSDARMTKPASPPVAHAELATE
jgi:hypothetical protein